MLDTRSLRIRFQTAVEATSPTVLMIVPAALAAFGLIQVFAQWASAPRLEAETVRFESQLALTGAIRTASVLAIATVSSVVLVVARLKVTYARVALALGLVLLAGPGLSRSYSIAGQRGYHELPFGVPASASNLASVLALALCASIIGGRADRIVPADERSKVVRPVMLLAWIALVVDASAPDLGEGFRLWATIVLVFVLVGIRASSVVSILLGTAVVVFPALLVDPYRRSTAFGFLDPFHDYRGQGYQAAQQLIAAGSGGWTGRGLGQSRATHGFLPEALSSSRFATIVEEIGLLGGGAVLLIFAFLVINCFRQQSELKNVIWSYILGSWIVASVALHVGANLGLLPNLGVQLPFVSTGSVMALPDGVLLGMAIGERMTGVIKIVGPARVATANPGTAFDQDA